MYPNVFINYKRIGTSHVPSMSLAHATCTEKFYKIFENWPKSVIFHELLLNFLNRDKAFKYKRQRENYESVTVAKI